MQQIFAGFMSGTSLDAVDGALMDFSPVTGRPTLLATASVDLPSELRALLIHLAHSETLSFTELATAEDGITHCYATCAQTLLDQAPNHLPLALGCHGQTIEHRPDAHPAFTLQLLNPSLLAELTGQNVTCDFRRRDLAAGGQAAPLVPAFHEALFSSREKNRLIINLGGIANITCLPADQTKPVTGFDTGPANLLLDHWYRQHQPGDFDPEGQWARQGKLLPELLQIFENEDYFRRRPPKSTGREAFNPAWLEQKLQQAQAIAANPKDILRTLVELTASTLAQAIQQQDPDARSELLVCGGGWHNQLLIERIQALTAPRPLSSTSRLGISPQWVEAAAFAWLAWRHHQKKTGNLPSVTGAQGYRILGGFYPA